MPDDELLYERMLATLVGSWERIAEGTDGSSVDRLSGSVIALFPAGPERLFYNNSVLNRGLDRQGARQAVEEILAAYGDAGIDRYAVWAHESEAPPIAELESRGLHVDTTTRAMAMSLDEIAVPRPEIDLAPSDWDEYLRIIELPEGTLAGVDPGGFHVLIGRLDGESVCAGMAYDRDGDCGIFNIGTLARARRRGLATALTALHLYRARERGCSTASLQSTEEAEGVYRAVGFRDLGRFIEFAR